MSGSTPAADANARTAEAAELERYGITEVPSHSYHLGEYRYTNMADAVAQAKRNEGSRANVL